MIQYSGSIGLLQILVISMLSSAGFAEPTLEAIGEAYDKDSTQLLYLEYHYRNHSTRQGKVEYLNPRHETLAIKTLEFGSKPIAPSFRQLDHRNGQLLSATYQDAALTMGYRTNHAAALKQQDAVINDELIVVDLGFDDFIRQNWAALTDGESISFRFAVPTRLSTVALTARVRRCEPEVDSAKTTCFRVKARNWLVNMVMPAIDVQYDSTSKQLRQFSGLGHLHDPAGKPMEVSIRYRYMTDPDWYAASLLSDQVSDRTAF